ncbi:hypothetical protein MCOR25_010403 [Pyricularia grisea]|nr:hypothetical protein MCOR25_010403 [Pyricularia grisea]
MALFRTTMDKCYICDVPFWAEVSPSPETVTWSHLNTTELIRQFDNNNITESEVAWLPECFALRTRFNDSIVPDLHIPIHWPCYEVVAGALTGRIGNTSPVQKDTLVEVWTNMTEGFQWPLDHKPDDRSEHAETPGFCTSLTCESKDVRAADPRPSEKVTLNLRRALEQISHKLVVQTPTFTSPASPKDQDRFAMLNYDITWMLSKYLTSKDLLALCSASPSVYRETTTFPGFWASRIHHEFPWFVEAHEILRDRSIQPPYHPKRLYTAILHETKVRCGVTGAWMPIVNRRYIWQRFSGEFARLYHKFRRPTALCKTQSDHNTNAEDVKRNIENSAICPYQARVSFPVPFAPGSTEPPSSFVKKVFWVKKWSQVYRLPAGFFAIRRDTYSPVHFCQSSLAPQLGGFYVASWPQVFLVTQPAARMMGTLDFKDPLPIQVPRDMYDFHLQTYNFGNYETVTWVTGIILNSSPIELEQIRRLWDDKNGGILPEHASLGRHCQTVRNVDFYFEGDKVDCMFGRIPELFRRPFLPPDGWSIVGFESQDMEIDGKFNAQHLGLLCAKRPDNDYDPSPPESTPPPLPLLKQPRLWRSSYRWRLATPIWSTPGVHMHEIVEREDTSDPRQFPLDMVPHYALIWDPLGTNEKNLRSMAADTIYRPGSDLDGTIVDLRFVCASNLPGSGKDSWAVRGNWWRSSDPKPVSYHFNEPVNGWDGERITGVDVVLGPDGGTRGIKFLTNQMQHHTWGFYVGRPRLASGEIIKQLRAPDGEKIIGLVVTFENNIWGEPDIMALSSVGLLTKEMDQAGVDHGKEKAENDYVEL